MNSTASGNHHLANLVDRKSRISSAVRLANLTADDIRDFLSTKFAKWWLPDAVEFIDEIPRTSTGKFQKRELRERFKDYRVA